jgi:pyruvyltransferase
MLRNLFKPKSIKAYWWNGVQNFGDALAPYLLEHFADIKVEWDTVSHSKIASIGSVLEHIPPLWDGYILGSGMLHEDSRLQLMQMGVLYPKILGLRGPLSARGIPGTFAIGDPGILADELVGQQPRHYDLGVLPHFADKELLPKYQRIMPAGTDIHFIDPTEADPLQVVREIGRCLRIVTSSLHGMIVADAFGIPRKVEPAKVNMRDGGDFKFRDYSASIQTKWEPEKMLLPSRYRIEDVKFQVYDAYRALKKELKNDGAF